MLVPVTHPSVFLPISRDICFSMMSCQTIAYNYRCSRTLLLTLDIMYTDTEVLGDSYAAGLTPLSKACKAGGRYSRRQVWTFEWRTKRIRALEKLKMRQLGLNQSRPCPACARSREDDLGSADGPLQLYHVTLGSSAVAGPTRRGQTDQHAKRTRQLVPDTGENWNVIWNHPGGPQGTASSHDHTNKSAAVALYIPSAFRKNRLVQSIPKPF